MLFSVLGSFPCSLKLSNKNSSPADRSFSSVPGVRDRGAALPADPGWDINAGASRKVMVSCQAGWHKLTGLEIKKKITSKFLS